MVCVSLSVRLMLPTTCCWPGETTEGPNAPTCSNEQSNRIVGIAAMAVSAMTMSGTADNPASGPPAAQGEGGKESYMTQYAAGT